MGWDGKGREGIGSYLAVSRMGCDVMLRRGCGKRNKQEEDDKDKDPKNNGPACDR